MFKELGFKFEKINYEGETYFYHNKDSYDGNDFLRIWFYLGIKKYVVSSMYGSNNYIDTKLHKAIHRQMKELGWVE
jgi:hypothetical protein